MNAKTKPTIDDILASIQKGERLGIEEALIFLASTKKAIDRSGMERFFDAARAEARKRPAWRRLDVETIDLSKTPVEALEERLQASDAERAFLRFPASFSAEEIFDAIERVAKHLPVGAFSPKEILDRSAKFKMKVAEFCRTLALAGLSFASGRFDAKGDDLATIDETFSALTQLAKAKIKTSACLPISFSEEEQAAHLAKLREFHDRTQAIDFVLLYLDGKFSDRGLLRSIALMRLMLDNLDAISLSDYDLSQEKKIDAELFRQCVELGLNQS
ncbi:MAG: hypothetical protein NZM06_03590 [Chloroherpetonaceae bacterium]|nr:hypothetical protein [Chloroherpetonaceae bacterium]MDW8437060.1 hypothetical protein [Chloroherpetonaceae bacterium]